MTLEELKELLKDPRFNRARSIFENSRLEVQVEATNLLALTWKVLRQEAPPPELPKNTDDLLRRALALEDSLGKKVQVKLEAEQLAKIVADAAFRILTSAGIAALSA